MKKAFAVLGILLVLAGIAELMAARHYNGRHTRHGAATSEGRSTEPPAYRGVVLMPPDQSLIADHAHNQALVMQIAATGANWIEVPIELQASGALDVAALGDLTHLAHERAINICLEFRLPQSERKNLPTEEVQQDQWLQHMWGPRVLVAIKAVEPLNIDLICLGNRLTEVQEREQAWNALIDAVRKIYKGSLTYAADADNYAYITWWSSLDYIGVVGDFPLCDDPDPTPTSLQSAWDAQLATLETINSHYSKLVLLLDVGYSTNPQVAHDPTLADGTGSARPDIQGMCYQSALEASAGRNWLAGIFIKPGMNGDTCPRQVANPSLNDLLARQWHGGISGKSR